HGYLQAVAKGTHRYDLDGAPAGEITDEHRKVAQEELTRRRAVSNERREQEEQGRRERAQLLRDFERTTLTEANFCALKGVAADQLQTVLAQARQEAEERPAQPPRSEHERGARGPGRGARDERGPRGGGGRPGGGGSRPASGGPRRGPKQG